jgi:outer membrane lipoprotein carrier protein
MNKFLTIYLYLLLPFGFIYGSSPEKEFFLALAEHSKSVSTVSGNFVQKKFITILNDSVESKGLFYYKRAGNMRFDYISPKEMSIVITPLRLYIVSAGKTNTFSLESQKGLSDLAAVMEACIGGDIKSIPAGYSVSYSFREKRHRLEITPNRVNTQSPYLKIEMVINPSNFSLEQLTLWERSKDYTIYRFSGAIVNPSVSLSMFQL